MINNEIQSIIPPDPFKVYVRVRPIFERDEEKTNIENKNILKQSVIIEGNLVK